MPTSFRRHRRARLDKLFERLLQAYRQTLLDAIACEPTGPARHLRAHINGLAEVVVARSSGLPLAAKLLQHARYQRIWQDFVAEACASDSDDHGLAHVTRYTADTRHLVEVHRPSLESAAKTGVVCAASIQRDLLSRCACSDPLADPRTYP